MFYCNRLFYYVNHDGFKHATVQLKDYRDPKNNNITFTCYQILTYTSTYVYSTIFGI